MEADANGNRIGDLSVLAPLREEDVELPRLPDVGESLETKFGTMLVAQAEEAPDLAAYAGRIVCRFS